ncbi:hypothetical protein BC830DRAFT_1097252 [Chytriomyces sp. MP71]|nr:hypothetical protein BC830DRAFT_1097252 [Chytriomyces sp. MP71]
MSRPSPSAQTQQTQTHTARRVSALVFALLFAYFVVHLCGFALGRVGYGLGSGGGDRESVPLAGVVLAFIVALYLSLLPAALIHGALTGAHAALLDSLVRNAWLSADILTTESAPQAAAGVPSTESHEWHPALILSRIATVASHASLFVPAFAHALANVFARLFFSLAHAACIKFAQVFPILVEVLSDRVHYGLARFATLLPIAYPYMESGILFLVKWIPVVCEYFRTGLLYLAGQCRARCIDLGTLIHDSWDPLIVPFISNAQWTALRLLEAGQVYLKGLKDLMVFCSHKLFGIAEFWSKAFIQFTTWASFVLQPYLIKLFLFVQTIASAFLKLSCWTSTAVHNALDIAFHYFIAFQIPQLLNHIYNAIVAAFQHTAHLVWCCSQYAHMALVHLFAFLDRFALFGKLYRAAQVVNRVTSPYVVLAWTSLYSFSLRVVARTKVIATPLIEAAIQAGTVCVATGTFYATEIHVFFVKTNLYRTLEGLVDWDVWNAVGAAALSAVDTVSRLAWDVILVIESLISAFKFQQSGRLQSVKVESEFPGKEKVH